MRQQWSACELDEYWTLLPGDLAHLADLPDAGKLGFAAQLAFWRQNGRFPNEEADFAPAVVGRLAAQIGVGADALADYDWAGRTVRRHRRDLLPRELASAALEEEIGGWFARERIIRPGAYRLDRILHSAQAARDDATLQRVADCFDTAARGRLNALLADDGEGTAFSRLAADPGRVGLESLIAEIDKLELLRALSLPPGLLHGYHPDQAKRFRRRATVENAWELRRHPERVRLALLAFYCVPRQGEVVDGLVELLIQVTHRITVKAERRVVEELVEEAREVRGKAGILFRVAEAAVGRPEGVVRRGHLPCRRRADLRGARPRSPGTENPAEPARPYCGARLVWLLLPSDDAPAARGIGVPLQQWRTPSPARRP